MTAGDMVTLRGGDDTHALLFRDAPRTRVGYGFGYAQDRKLQLEKPKVSNRIAGFAHKTLALPLGSDPETSVLVIAAHEADAPDDLARIGLQAQRPMPGLAALDGRQSHVTIKPVSPI